MLGFMKRICNDFDDVSVFISLYFAFVRSHLEYAAVVWNPSYVVHSIKIEYIQKKIFSFLFIKLGYFNLISFAPYTIKCRILNIEHMYDKDKCASALFVFDILTGRIDTPCILSLLDIGVPARLLRNNQNSLLRIRVHRTNYGSFDPDVLSMSTFINEFYHLFDFGQSRSSYRYCIRCCIFQNLIELSE